MAAMVLDRGIAISRATDTIAISLPTPGSDRVSALAIASGPAAPRPARIAEPTTAFCGKMAPRTANPAGDPARSPDLARLGELTSPHLPHPRSAHRPGARPHDPGRPRRDHRHPRPHRRPARRRDRRRRRLTRARSRPGRLAGCRAAGHSLAGLQFPWRFHHPCRDRRTRRAGPALPERVSRW